MMISWLTKWFTSGDKNTCSEQRPSSVMSKKYNADFYNNYFSLIAQGAQLKLVEAMFRLNLFSLFEHQNCVLERDIIEQLELMPNRALKWLHLLAEEHFLVKITAKDGQVAYQLPEEFIALLQGDNKYWMTLFFASWSEIADESLTEALRFGSIRKQVFWPPKTEAQVKSVEEWMTYTAEQPLRCILEHIDFSRVTQLLDVGGGDGTMACSIVNTYPHLQATVYNVPLAAELARNTIEAKGLNGKVAVLEGNFIDEDSFPSGYDLILFSRVLFDWDESLCRKLLRMAYQALPEKGMVAVCEFFKDEADPACLVAEYRYIFFDAFAVDIMKTPEEYHAMLKEIGFTIIIPNTSKQQPLYDCTLILAQK